MCRCILWACSVGHFLRILVLASMVYPLLETWRFLYPYQWSLYLVKSQWNQEFKTVVVVVNYRQSSSSLLSMSSYTNKHWNIHQWRDVYWIWFTPISLRYSSNTTGVISVLYMLGVYEWPKMLKQLQCDMGKTLTKRNEEPQGNAGGKTHNLRGIQSNEEKL